jgi:hypothetical protein
MKYKKLDYLYLHLLFDIKYSKKWLHYILYKIIVVIILLIIFY